MKTKEKFKEALTHCTNVQEFFNVCEQYYDLKSARLGTITKKTLINNIDKILLMTGAKLKN